uniref:Uncharacterized protein n=1 Tax=Acrobeloides nanus TaxID=290746 RepID=A0A914E9M9_9BILA
MKIYILLVIVAVAFLQLQALPIGDVSDGCVAGICNNVNADLSQNREKREPSSIGNAQRTKGKIYCTSGSGPIWCGFRKDNE